MGKGTVEKHVTLSPSTPRKISTSGGSDIYCMLPCCAGMGDTTGGSGGAPGGTGGPVAAGGTGIAAGVLSIVTKSGVITRPELYLRQSKTGVVWSSWRSL